MLGRACFSWKDSAVFTCLEVSSSHQQIVNLGAMTPALKCNQMMVSFLEVRVYYNQVVGSSYRIPYIRGNECEDHFSLMNRVCSIRIRIPTSRSGKFGSSYLIGGLLGRLGIMDSETLAVHVFLKRDTPLAITVVCKSMFAAEDGTIPANSQVIFSSSAKIFKHLLKDHQVTEALSRAGLESSS
ncbi:hypothetical protein Tco_1412579, partial [Tanacetum coccineum]